MPSSPTASTSSSALSRPTPDSLAFELLADHFASPREAIRFMRAFAGLIFAVPAMPAVEKLAREWQIAEALHEDPHTPTVRRLASLHSLPMRAVAKSFARSTGKGLKHFRTQASACKRSWADTRKSSFPG